MRGRILVVDDAELMCRLLQMLLADRGHDVRTALDGAGALAAIEQFDCQVAVVDYRLPDTNGIDLVLEIRSRLPRVEAIMMTSYGDADIPRRAAAAGCFAFVRKPFNNEHMIRTIEQALHRAAGGGGSPDSGGDSRTGSPDPATEP
ncbi:MAG: response regulator [Myxococcota bacterium]|nr:response regulator [Myxococcota bacterium]